MLKNFATYGLEIDYDHLDIKTERGMGVKEYSFEF